MKVTASQTFIGKDTTQFKSQDGFAEYEFNEIVIKHNPASFAGIRFEQGETDKNGKRIQTKINLSHTQAKKLKKILRDLYPRD
jgi:hypothetical protein